MTHYRDKGSLKSSKLSGKIAQSPPMRYDDRDSPAVSVLEKATDGLICLKVESDIMAYILYCYYDEFARIQQTYQVAITWSGKDNKVIICTPSHSDASQLHLATQQFLSFYHHIASNLVAAPLNSHVTNITLHQYHKAAYEVKKLHSKAMIKEVKTTGRIALYCPDNELREAKRTFLIALSKDDSSESLSGDSIGMSGEEFYESSSPNLNQREPGSTLKKTGLFKNAYQTPSKQRDMRRSQVFEHNHSHSFAHHTYSPTSQIKSASAFSQPNYQQLSEIKINGKYFDEENGIPVIESEPAMRPKLSEETASSNGSSGYGSNSGTISRHFSQYPTKIQDRSRSNAHIESKLQVLPAITQHSSLKHTYSTPPQPVVNNSSAARRPLSPDCSHYYYDDIQHSEAVSPPRGAQRPKSQERLLSTQNGSYLYHNDGTNKSTEKPPILWEDKLAAVQKWNSLSRVKNTTVPSPLAKNYSQSSGLVKKPSIIPKMESPFRFLQHHKKYFEVTTPTGLAIEVHEGDVTDAGCDVIVNITNEQLHVTGELAWAVAKHGLFEIPKQTKLHVAMHGPVMESKVMVTPSAGLPSLNIIHAVAPKWNRNDLKKSKKLLYNTYKNIFNVSNVQLRAKSLALPVIGLGNMGKSDESFPFHIATEVMYQALIAFLKLGATTLRHIRYIDNDPDHVNLIVTSIKPKIENVTYDARFLSQNQPQRRKAAMSSAATMYSDSDSNSNARSPTLMMSPVHDARDAFYNSRTLPNVNTRGKTLNRR